MTTAVVQKMALGAGIGLVAAGVGQLFGGTRGLAAGAAVGGATLFFVNLDLKPLSEIFLSNKKKEALLKLILSLTSIAVDLWKNSDNIHLNSKTACRLIENGLSKGIPQQIMELIGDEDAA